MEKQDFDRVRNSVRSNCGNKVMIQLDRGRNKVDIMQGVITGAYPSLFTVRIDESSPDNKDQVLSFSYADIITKDIRMKIC